MNKNTCLHFINKLSNVTFVNEEGKKILLDFLNKLGSNTEMILDEDSFITMDFDIEHIGPIKEAIASNLANNIFASECIEFNINCGILKNVIDAVSENRPSWACDKVELAYALEGKLKLDIIEILLQ